MRTLGILVLVLGIAGHGRAECGPYEDAQRTTYRQLSWTDFDEPRPSRYRGRMGDVVEQAHIAMTLRLESPQIEVWTEGPGRWVARLQRPCVRAFMLKDRSGYKPEERSRLGLAHEQGHFDITEYFARELRGRLTGLKHRADSQAQARRGLWEAVKREFAETVAGWVAMQARYDRETRPKKIRVGQNRIRLSQDQIGVQNRWLEKIEDLLTPTNDFGGSRNAGR